MENCIQNIRYDSLQLCAKTVFWITVTAAHTVHVNDEDMLLMKERMSYRYTIRHNLLLGSRHAKMLKAGIKPAIGTDGASNNTLDMFKEMHLTSLIHRGYKGDSNVINARQVLTMAANGARALGFDKCGMIKQV